MKKLLAFILAVIYFIATTGATVNIHYCMGKLQSMDLWHSQKKKETCFKCGMASKRGCCEDRHQVVKFEKKYNIPVTDVSATKVSNLPGWIYEDLSVHEAGGDVTNCTLSSSPPGKKNVSLFIRYRVIRL